MNIIEKKKTKLEELKTELGETKEALKRKEIHLKELKDENKRQADVIILATGSKEEKHAMKRRRAIDKHLEPVTDNYTLAQRDVGRKGDLEFIEVLSARKERFTTCKLLYSFS